MRRFLLGVVISGLVVGCAGDSDTTPTSPPDQSELAQLQGDAIAVASSITVDVAALPAEDPAGDPRETVGVVAPVGVPVSFAGLRVADLDRPTAVSHGAIARHDGTIIWSATVVAANASALRLELTDVYLPHNTELYIYSNRGEVAGPYLDRGPMADGSFWTNTLRGNQMHLQLRYRGNDAERVLAAARFTIANAGVLDNRFEMARYSKDDAAFRAFCSFNAPCVLNAECGSLPSAVADAQAGVAHMLFADKGWMYMCSGGLIADTDDATETPYFLTANHCISRDRSAKSLETYFHFTTPCGGGCFDASIRGTLGASVVATNKTGDYSLLLLSQLPPADTAYLPFSTTEIAYTNGADLYRISHPAGAPQAYSHHVVDTAKGTCSSWPRGSWIYSRDVEGATEGGSSGSPVVNAAGEIVGQLSGGCGTNLNDDCDSTNNATVDGALASYYPEVAAYLDPIPCNDADGDGYCAPDDCNDANPAVNPGAAEICEDGLDNDCSGGDATCGSGGCDLGAPGADCSDNGDCCSNKCVGKPGAKTCK